MISMDVEQQEILTSLCKGQSKYQIATKLDINQAELNSELQDMQAKVGAKTNEHMIARCFALGIISARHLCLVFMFASSTNLFDDQNAIRPKTRARTASVMRLSSQHYGVA